MLSRGSRTEAELAARLERIGYSAGKVAETIARCRELRYVDDAAVAMDRARARAWRLLAARGFPEDVIADVVPDGE